ncbi:MAG: hypothetical protein K1060chlam1_00158 [Candidatus Anoxychlamydiales bacterium]|nr:hypothetical protein [Candidatus Anoxychlamydiales bacterium]
MVKPIGGNPQVGGRAQDSNPNPTEKVYKLFIRLEGSWHSCKCTFETKQIGEKFFETFEGCKCTEVSPSQKDSEESETGPIKGSDK